MIKYPFCAAVYCTATSAYRIYEKSCHEVTIVFKYVKSVRQLLKKNKIAYTIYNL